MKDELLNLYIEAIKDSTGWFLSYYCSDLKEREKRLHEDEELIENFKILLEQL